MAGILIDLEGNIHDPLALGQEHTVGQILDQAVVSIKAGDKAIIYRSYEINGTKKSDIIKVFVTEKEIDDYRDALNNVQTILGRPRIP